MRKFQHDLRLVEKFLVGVGGLEGKTGVASRAEGERTRDCREALPCRRLHKSLYRFSIHLCLQQRRHLAAA